MAGLLAGDPASQISHMYLQFENSNSTANPPVVADVLTRSSGLDELVAATAADGMSPYRDWLRVPLLSTPKIIKVPDSTSSYSGNGVIFSTSSGASSTMTGECGIPFGSTGANGPSWIFSVALVAAGSISNSGQDKIFSRVNLLDSAGNPAPIAPRPGSQLAFFWMLTFN